jgi:predicted nucleic acid-binding protein
VNVLVALHDTKHQFHSEAHVWFAAEGQNAWATCPLTENGFARVLCQPAYPNALASPADALALLDILITGHAETYSFWPDDISLRDTTLFHRAHITGHRQTTDFICSACARGRVERSSRSTRGLRRKRSSAPTQR